MKKAKKLIDVDEKMTPNPIFSRGKTTVINDGWKFSFDNKKWRDICVPFCPESKLSGIGYTDFIPVCYYKKKFTLKKVSERITLNFGAVDYFTTVYVNGIYIGSHKGGYTPVSFDISAVIRTGENEIFLVVRDDEFGKTASGKQSPKKQSYGCFYTRTTGIWQSVWLEETPFKFIKEFYFYPDVENCSINIDLLVSTRGTYKVAIFYEGKKVGESSGEIFFRKKIAVSLSEKHLWKIGEGNLYDVKIYFENDEVLSYFGLREVFYKGYDFFLNGEKTYQALVMLQGYDPEGIYTSPSIEKMQKDVALVKELGFNGVRLHQKVFEPQFLYLLDKAGLMAWGEFASWGLDYSDLNCFGQFVAEWQETLKRDFNHPSIVVWSPLNEVWGDLDDHEKIRDVKFIDCVYDFTKTFDETRPCVDVSGGHHGHRTDLYDFHCYEESEKIREYLTDFERNGKLNVRLLYCKKDDLRYSDGTPLNLSECGGISFGFEGNANCQIDTVNECAVCLEEPWGYGDGAVDGNDFVNRYRKLIEVISEFKKISGFCYTQLYDIEQERNGFYYYDRSDKLTEEQKKIIRTANKKVCYNY